jgi:glycosyltransferase involved in cell wall biosynthesis
MSGDTPWFGGRVAIVHDWFQGYHGAERLVEALADEVLADAARVDVMTFHAARELLPTTLSERIVRESRLGRLPGVRQVGHDPGRWRYLLPYMAHYFRSLPLEGYDLVIASSHACAVQASPPPDVPYVCYCHTPMRYAWMSEIESDRARGIRGAALRLAAGPLRRSDARAAERPELYVVNSSAVRERVRRFYGRDATVVHPPVHTDDLGPAEKEPGRFLWTGRLVAYKKPELAVEAFRSLSGARLTMVGIGPLESRIRESLPANVELLGWTSRDDLAWLHSTASGFIQTGEEDFGMSMGEALASGTPVIALNAGGARDIVRDGVDGILVDAPTPTAFAAAIDEASRRPWDAASLVARGREFSTAAFTADMRGVLSEAVAASRAR